MENVISNKRVLVTGADGFIGSHLVEELVTRGTNVRALSCYNSFNNWGWLDNLGCLKDVEVVSGDIRDIGFVNSICKDVDIIFHLAALIAIPYSYHAPRSYVDTNVTGTLNVCQAALEKGCLVIHTSTSEVYGTAKYVPIDEKHPIQPQSPYSASKIGADMMAKSFRHSFNLPLIVVRPFNTYGPRQSARAVIPTIITQITSGKETIRLGALNPTRDFNFVEDVCGAIIDLAQCEKALGQTVNIGSCTEISIGDTANLIKDIMRADVEFITTDERLRPANSEVERLYCDNTKIKSLINYKPKYDLKEGLQKTVEWFVQPANLARYKADIYNV